MVTTCKRGHGDVIMSSQVAISMPFGLKADCTVHEALFRRFPPSLFPSSQKTLFPFNTMGLVSYTLKGSNSFDRYIDRFVELCLEFGALKFNGACAFALP